MSSKSLTDNDIKQRSLSDKIKAEAKRLGFFACGIAKAEAVDTDTADTYRQWIGSGMHADMSYLANNINKRLDPTLLMPGARSIICVALAYAPKTVIPENEYQIAKYAYGHDYHEVVKDKLRQLAALLPTETKICCDTVPILERYWAEKAGIGWIGRNHQLIIPHAGSMFFLGEIITDVYLTYDPPAKNHCGDCHECMKACPTGALASDRRHIDARRCLSYLTIENRDEISDEFKKDMGNCIYGCDRCLDACPWNKKAAVTTEPLLQANEKLLLMTREKWNNLTIDEYRDLFRGSAIKRAKYEGLTRNIKAIQHP